MPMYFFHFFDGSDLCEDDVGLEFASAEVAYLQAFTAARVMWSELLEEQRDPTRCAFEIVDSRGALLFRLGFPEVLESCRRDGLKTSSSLSPIAALESIHRRVDAAKDALQTSIVEARKSLSESQRLLARLRAVSPPVRKAGSGLRA